MKAIDAGFSILKAGDSPCDPPCKTSPMLGTSWWKNLGYNSPCGCAETDRKAGKKYAGDK